MKSRAVLLDRDGVINENKEGYVKSWDEFVFLPMALEALRKLARTPYRIIVITNQAAVAKGIISSRRVEEIHRRMLREIQEGGGRIDGVYYCPHSPADKCACRKPRPGLLTRAGREFELDLSRSYCIGDKLSDLDAGREAGCRGILVLTGEGLRQDTACLADYAVVANLLEAAQLIVDESGACR
jgi:D-glycero-D-manno-heptose 1,7-bisphosphate phosphatase